LTGVYRGSTVPSKPGGEAWKKRSGRQTLLFAQPVDWSADTSQSPIKPFLRH
jgi:hypothetical protein